MNIEHIGYCFVFGLNEDWNCGMPLVWPVIDSGCGLSVAAYNQDDGGVSAANDDFIADNL